MRIAARQVLIAGKEKRHCKATASWYSNEIPEAIGKCVTFFIHTKICLEARQRFSCSTRQKVSHLNSCSVCSALKQTYSMPQSPAARRWWPWICVCAAQTASSRRRWWSPHSPHTVRMSFWQFPSNSRRNMSMCRQGSGILTTSTAHWTQYWWWWYDFGPAQSTNRARENIRCSTVRLSCLNMTNSMRCRCHFIGFMRRPWMSFKCTASDDYNDWQLGRLNRTYHDGWQIKFWATQFSLITRKRLIDTKLNDYLIQLNNLGFSTKNRIFNFVCYNFGHTPNNGKQSLPTHKILDVLLSSPI